MTEAKIPRISVIIPTYNRVSILADVINSVRQQDFKKWECIVVDDGSVDDTRQIMGDRYNMDHRIRIVRKAHGGVSSARNLGIKMARSNIVSFLDSDDVYFTDTLRLFVRALEAYPQAGVVYGIERQGKQKHEPDDVGMILFDVYPKLVDANFIASAVAVSLKNIPDIRFNEALQTVEDYQFLLDITRKLPAVQINKPIFNRRNTGQKKSQKMITDGTYGPAMLNIAHNEIDRLSTSNRTDCDELIMRWRQREAQLKLLAAGLKGNCSQSLAAAGELKKVATASISDFSYTAYGISDSKRILSFARCVIPALNNTKSLSDSSGALAIKRYIIDALFCKSRELRGYNRLKLSLAAYALLPSMFSLKRVISVTFDSLFKNK